MTRLCKALLENKTSVWKQNEKKKKPNSVTHKILMMQGKRERERDRE